MTKQQEFLTSTALLANYSTLLAKRSNLLAEKVHLLAEHTNILSEFNDLLAKPDLARIQRPITLLEISNKKRNLASNPDFFSYTYIFI